MAGKVTSNELYGDMLLEHEFRGEFLPIVLLPFVNMDNMYMLRCSTIKNILKTRQ